MRGSNLLLSVLLLTQTSLGAEPPPQKKASPESVRKRYEKLPLKALAIAEPIEIAEVLYYKDGGSIGLVFRDAKKQEHKLCMDGRKVGVFPIILNVAYPTDKAPARRLDVRSAEEAEVYALLLRWIGQHKHRSAFFDMKNDLLRSEYGNLWEFRVFFGRLERRYLP